jgi:predicted DNA-binding transcriptional regulator YafY
MKTSARLLRLLTLLQTRREWPGAELSARLEVDVRTLRRDVDRLRELGYEIQASSGVGGGYRLGAGKALPPLRLDDEEAVAIAVALGSVVASVPQLQETAVRVLVKLDQLLPERLRRRVSALQSVTLSMTAGPAVDPALLTAIASACREHERLTFTYEDSRGATKARTVEPLQLAHTGRVWYLVAWDMDREDWRTFRVDRIDPKRGVRVGARFIPRRPPEDLATYVSRSISTAPYRYQVRLKLAGPVAEVAERVPSWVGVLEPLDAKSCVLTTGGDSLEALVAQVVLAGVDFELLEPEELRPGIREVGKRLVRGTR